MVRQQPEENVPKRRHETTTQSKPKSKVRLAFTAAALLCTAIIFNFCAAAPAKAAAQDAFEYPISKEILLKKALAQCDDTNLSYKVARVSSLAGATALDFMGMFGLANASLALFNAWYPNNPLDAKQIDCPTVVKEVVEEASQFTWQRDMVAERGARLAQKDPSLKAVASHRNYVNFFDISLFHRFWSASSAKESMNQLHDQRYKAALEADQALIVIQAVVETERQVKNGRSTRALAPKPGS